MAKAWKPEELAQRVFVVVRVGVLLEIGARVLLGF